MWINSLLMAVIGLSAGFTVAAGLGAFMIELGVISDFADRTHTGEHVLLYEDSAALGGILGNLFYIYQIAVPGEKAFLAFVGLFGMLGNGARRDFKCISDCDKKNEAYKMYSVYYFRSGAGKRNRRMAVFCESLVNCLRMKEKKKEKRRQGRWIKRSSRKHIKTM